MQMPIAVSMLFMIISFAAVGADNAPTVGILYNSKEIGSLTYSCEPDKKLLRCDFVQLSVRKRAKAEDLGEVLRKASVEYRKGTTLSVDECKNAKQIADILEGRMPAPKPQSVTKMTGVERKDVSESIKAVLEYCSAKSEESYLNIIRLSHSKKVRTCALASNTFQQTFQPVEDRVSRKNAWVTKSSPEGSCGIVQLSRFEPVVSGSFTFWNYFAKKAITNPKATWGASGVECGKLDQDEYPYQWQSIETQASCDYIEFSPI